VRRDTGSIVVAVNTYLVEPGEWHFVLKTASGTHRSPVSFRVPASPAPAIVRLRPTEAPRDGEGPLVVEVEGRHFARLESVKLAGEGPARACTVVRAPAAEPNDRKLSIQIDRATPPGTYRIVVETASGTSEGDATFRVLPTAVDRFDALVRRVLVAMSFDGLDAGAKESVDAALRAARDLDPALRDMVARANQVVTLPEQDLLEVSAELARLDGDAAVAKRVREQRAACPEWIALGAEKVYARFLQALEPKKRSPSEDEVQAYVRAAAGAGGMLRVGASLFWNEGRTKRLRASLVAAVAVFRDLQLPHVFSKIKESVPDAVESSGSSDEGWV
ncbi:MAG: hypothetical protein ACAI25_09945, partial [Planctomycetota bacterium]